MEERGDEVTHDQIMQAARERIAEIDREKARLEDERAKLQALLGAQPVTPPATWVKPQTAGDVPTLDTCPHCQQQRWTFGDYRMCSCSGSIGARPAVVAFDPSRCWYCGRENCMETHVICNVPCGNGQLSYTS